MLDPKDYSTKTISQKLIQDIRNELNGLEYGSVELYVADGFVTQISRRQIKKTAKANGQKSQ